MKRKHTDYINLEPWFAWKPVKTEEGWVWLIWIYRIIDDRPLVYLGLMEEYHYYTNKDKADEFKLYNT